MIGPPILLLGFNRPDRLAALIESLRESQPPTVYISIDGPRDSVDSDREGVQQTRDLVSSIDWTADVHTGFHEKNLGIALAIPTAVSWVLAEHESVIGTSSRRSRGASRRQIRRPCPAPGIYPTLTPAQNRRTHND